VTKPNQTIMQYIATNNEYTGRTGQQLKIRSLDELKNKASADIPGGGRAVASRYDANMLKPWMPMPYRFLPVYQDGLPNFTVPGHRPHRAAGRHVPERHQLRRRSYPRSGLIGQGLNEMRSVFNRADLFVEDDRCTKTRT
jgi:hypothetical protein